jgi:hypothetical protein
MNYLKLLVISALFSGIALAQTTYDVTATGGTLTAKSPVAPTLSASSTVIAVQKNGGTITFESGTVTLSTGRRNGNLQIGGTATTQRTFRPTTFAAGGSFVVTTANDGEIFNGTVTSGQWTLAILANGTHRYTMVGTLQDAAGNTGAFALHTTVAPTIPGFFNGKETISHIEINFTIQ